MLQRARFYQQAADKSWKKLEMAALARAPSTFQ